MGHIILAASSGKYLVLLWDSTGLQFHVLRNDVSLCSFQTEFSYWHEFLKEPD